MILRYRQSRFNNERNGRFLAMVASRLSRFVVDREPKLVTHRGIVLEADPAEIIGFSLIVGNSFESEVESLLERFVTDGTTCLDIGANIGYHTLPMAWLVGEAGRVIAVEPSQWALERLYRNLERNPEIRERVSVVEGLLSDRVEVSTCAVQASYPMNGKEPKTELIRFQTLTLDGVLKDLKIDQMHFIKCDVDGAEPTVLLGAKSTLVRWKPQMLLEVTPYVWDQDAKSQIVELFESLDYKIYDVYSRPITQFSEYLDNLRTKRTSSVVLLS